MNPDPASLQSGFSWLTWFAGELAFKWLPGTVSGAAGSAIIPNFTSFSTSTPASAGDVATYLGTISVPGFGQQFTADWTIYLVCVTLLTLILLAVIIYCAIRVWQIRDHEDAKFAASVHPVASHDVSRAQLRWNRVLEEIGSEDEQKWRLAILEADIMLNELLDTMGYKGETMGDKMRGVERGDFNTIDIAWEAHRARNQIAHEGSAHLLTGREARRIIGLYEQVFREFRYIE